MRGQWEYKDHWLDNNVNGSARYYVYWYESDRDRRAGKKRRKSLKTENLGEAQDRLIAFILERNTSGSDALIISVLDQYITDLEEGRITLGSPKPAFRAQVMITEALDGEETVDELEEAFQKEKLWTYWRKTYGHSANYMARHMSVLKAAIDHCGVKNPPHIIQTEARIARSLKIKKTNKEKWFPKSDDDLARFVDAQTSDYAFRWIIVALTTACRPEAGIDLGPSQFDYENMILDLNPGGRAQHDNKWRPVQRLTECLAGWGKTWDTGIQFTRDDAQMAILKREKPWKLEPRFIPYAGIDSLESAFHRTRQKVDMPKMCPYSIRNKMITVLRIAQVPGSQRSIWMGHMDEEEKRITSGSYGAYDPTFLKEAAEATDEFMTELNKRTDRDLFAPSPGTKEDNSEQSQCKFSAKINVVQFEKVS